MSPDGIPLERAILVAVGLLAIFGRPTYNMLLALSIASIVAVIWAR